MSSRIEWVIENCRLLAAIGEEFERTRPFDGLTIGTGIHLEPKTVALLLTLQRGGAELVSTGNLNTTQQEAVDYLRGARRAGRSARRRRTRPSMTAISGRSSRARPQLLLDNGGDLFARWLEEPYDGLLGGTEETTSGRMRLEPLRDRIGAARARDQRQPDQAVRREPARRRPERRSSRSSASRTASRTAGASPCSATAPAARASPRNFRNAYAGRLGRRDRSGRAPRGDARRLPRPGACRGAADADVVITVTGARGVVTAADLPLLRDGAILANAGHFPWEIDVAGAASRGRVEDAPATASRRSPCDGRRSTCSRTGTWSTSPGRGRSATRSSRWISASRCRRAASRRSRAATVGRRVVRRPRAARDRRGGCGRVRRALERADRAHGLTRQMSRPFQLGIHASPRISVTTNGRRRP